MTGFLCREPCLHHNHFKGFKAEVPAARAAAGSRSAGFSWHQRFQDLRAWSIFHSFKINLIGEKKNWRRNWGVGGGQLLQLFLLVPLLPANALVLQAKIDSFALTQDKNCLLDGRSLYIAGRRCGLYCGCKCSFILWCSQSRAAPSYPKAAPKKRQDMQAPSHDLHQNIATDIIIRHFKVCEGVCVSIAGCSPWPGPVLHPTVLTAGDEDPQCHGPASPASLVIFWLPVSSAGLRALQARPSPCVAWISGATRPHRFNWLWASGSAQPRLRAGQR